MRVRVREGVSESEGVREGVSESESELVSEGGNRREVNNIIN